MTQNPTSTPTPAIRLVAPADESITQPLQKHAWPKIKQQVAEEFETYTHPNEYPERSLPHPVQFRWQSLNSQSNHARYDLYIDRDPSFENAIVVSDLESMAAEVPSLLVGTRYYWKVIQQRNGSPAAESNVASFVTHAAPPRWIQVPGITNVRDLGGWRAGAAQRVRQGMVYRSAEMNTHIILPPEGERVLVEELGIRTDLDLRGTADDENPAPALDPQRVRWASCPLYAYKDIFSAQGKESIRRAFHVMADPTAYPLLMHCWAGADRTGTLAFLVNGMLGISYADLIHDYELTSLSRIGLRLESGYGFQEIIEGLSAYQVGRATLQEKIEAYLLDAGVTQPEMQRMRDILLETI